MDLADLERAVDADPKNAALRFELGTRLLESGRADDAIDPLRRAMILQKEFVEAYLALGRALMASGEDVAATATLEAGRDLALTSRKASDVELVPRFEELLAGRGPAKRSHGAPMDEAAFAELARATLASIAERLATLPRGEVALQHTPSVLVFEVARRAKMGLSEQRSHREIWCTSAMGELRFKHMSASGRWRAGGGEDLLAVVGDFVSRQLGRPIRVE